MGMRLDGPLEGSIDGIPDGLLEGSIDGRMDGPLEDSIDGRLDGRLKGQLMGDWTTICIVNVTTMLKAMISRAI